MKKAYCDAWDESKSDEQHHCRKWPDMRMSSASAKAHSLRVQPLQVLCRKGWVFKELES